MAMQPYNRSRQQVQSSQTQTLGGQDPWDFPSVEISFSQLPSTRWTATRTVKWPNLNVLDTDTVMGVQEHLDALDGVIRQHIADLYARDSEEREAYFSSKKNQGSYEGSNW